MLNKTLTFCDGDADADGDGDADADAGVTAIALTIHSNSRANNVLRDLHTRIIHIKFD